MLKKIISFVLAITMLFSVLIVLSGCETETEETVSSRLPITLNMVGITSEETTPEAVKAVEAAINVVTMNEFKTKINLTLVTEDQYYNLIQERIDAAEHQKNVSAAIEKYNRYAQTIANQLAAQQASSSSGLGKWRRGTVIVEAETIATTSAYTKEMTTKDENGFITTLYPDPACPIDIVMILGKDMYDYFDSLDILKDVSSLITSGTAITDYKQLGQFIYPTYFDELKAITGAVKAVPTNHLLAEYTYLVVDAELADKYNFNIETVKDYSDLKAFLQAVKENEPDYVPFEKEQEALGIYYPFGEDVAIATYLDPLDGYNTDEGKTFKIQNLFDIKQYKENLTLMEEYRNEGYFGTGAADEKYAVKVVKGDKSIEDLYSDSYVKVIQNPFVEEDSIFAGMMGVTSFGTDASIARALEVVQAFNTDGVLKNLLQYGIEGVNYKVNEDGKTITRLNHDYLMNTMLTGNLYTGYPEEGQLANLWDYYKTTNLDSLLSPFLIYYISEADLESKLSAFIERAEISQALDEVLGITYSELQSAVGSTNYTKYVNALKLAYKPYLLQCLIADGIKESNVESAFNGTVKTSDWYLKKIAIKVGEDHPEYSQIATATGLKNLIHSKYKEILGIAYSKSENSNVSYEKYKADASKYFENIKFLRIMVEILFDLTDEEKAQYNSMTDSQFETAIVEYVKDNYIKENNLSESDYDALVKQYITSDIGSFYDNLGNSYTITWEDVVQSEKDAQEFIKAMEKAVEYYSDILKSSPLYNENDNPTVVFDTLQQLLYKQYVTDEGTTIGEFQTAVYNEVLEDYNITKSALDKLRTTNVLEYNNIISKLKSKYKNEILQYYSQEKYKESGSYALTASEILTAILNYKVEEKTQIIHNIAKAANVSYSSFLESKNDCAKYINYVNKINTSFIYTLRAYYPNTNVNNIRYDKIMDTVYEAVYNYGYYTNETAKIVGQKLTDYSNSKSSSTNYTTQLTKLINYFENDIKALGYNIDEFRKFNSEDIEAVIDRIIEEQYYSDIITINEYLEELCSEYFEGLEDSDNKSAYISDLKAKFKDDYLLNSIIESLDEEWTEAQAK